MFFHANAFPMIGWLHLYVQTLKTYQGQIGDKHAEALSKATPPAGEVVDPDELHAWVDSEKVFLAAVETSIRDAKRRVTLKKGPKKRAPEPAEGSGNASDDDGSCTDDE